MESPESIIKVQFKTKVNFILVKTLVKKSPLKIKNEDYILNCPQHLACSFQEKECFRMLQLAKTSRINCELFITAPPWPNGYGIGLLNRGLGVRVPPEVKQIFFVFVFSSLTDS